MTKKYHYTKKTGRPRKYTDANLFDKKVNQYFIDCDANLDKSGNGEVYSVTGLALYLGLDSRHRIPELAEKEDFTASIKKALVRIEKQCAESLVKGKGWGPGWMFVLKNNFGWKDVLDVHHGDAEGGMLEMSSLEVAARISTILELAKRRKEEADVQKALPEKIEVPKNGTR